MPEIVDTGLNIIPNYGPKYWKNDYRVEPISIKK